MTDDAHRRPDATAYPAYAVQARGRRAAAAAKSLPSKNLHLCLNSLLVLSWFSPGSVLVPSYYSPGAMLVLSLFTPSSLQFCPGSPWFYASSLLLLSWFSLNSLQVLFSFSSGSLLVLLLFYLSPSFFLVLS